MDALADEGFVVLGGPLGDGEVVLLIVEAAGTEEIRGRLAADPWTPSRMLEIAWIEPWEVLLGQPDAPASRRRDWIERYRRAWKDGDPDAAAALFSPDAIYRSDPFREPARGRDAIREYWRTGTSTQRDVRIRMGEPVVAGDRVAVEWWTTMVDADEETTLPGCLVLRFDENDLCSELREYGHLAAGREDPPPGWGS